MSSTYGLSGIDIAQALLVSVMYVCAGYLGACIVGLRKVVSFAGSHLSDWGAGAPAGWKTALPCEEAIHE